MPDPRTQQPRLLQTFDGGAPRGHSELGYIDVVCVAGSAGHALVGDPALVHIGLGQRVGGCTSGQRLTCTATYVVTQAALDSGELTNTAAVTATESSAVVSAQAQATVTTPAASPPQTTTTTANAATEPPFTGTDSSGMIGLASILVVAGLGLTLVALRQTTPTESMA